MFRCLTFLKISDTRSDVIARDQQQWFYSTPDGQRIGPVGFDYLLELSQSGQLDPRNDMVWSTALNDWEPAGEVEGLFERRAVRRDNDSLAGTETLSQTTDYNPGPMVSKGQFLGTDRLGYVMGAVVAPTLLVLFWKFAVKFLQPHVPVAYHGYLQNVVLPLAGLLIVVTTVKRLHNVGMSGWWVLGFAVPLLNVWLGYRCFACPPGYSGVKKLGGLGKFLAVLYWGAVLGIVGLIGMGLAGKLGEMNDSGFLEEISRQFKELRASALRGR